MNLVRIDRNTCYLDNDRRTEVYFVKLNISFVLVCATSTTKCKNVTLGLLARVSSSLGNVSNVNPLALPA